MQRLGCQFSECRGTFWRPRCGTLLIRGETALMPSLVMHCREFEEKHVVHPLTTGLERAWHTTGCGESIRTPEQRPSI